MKIPALALIAVLFHSALFAGETPLAIDTSHSHIEAIITSAMENFTANLTAYDTIISVDPVEKRVGSAVLKFRFADIKTGNEKRDSTMRAWQQTDQFPECVYVLDALLPAGGGSFKARGKFILHGITKDLTIPVTISFANTDTCMIDGDVALDTTAFGLPPIRQYVLLKVNPTLQVKFHLEGRVQADLLPELK